MAIYHFSAQIISRGSGKSSVAAAAYRSGEKLVDERTGLNYDYTKKEGVEYTEILAPPNSPEWTTDRNKLWNEVEKIEKAKDSQLAREINIALPKELSNEQNIKLIKEFVKDNFVNKGMVADIAIHNGHKEIKDNLESIPVEERINNTNIHAHIMVTMRPFKEDGTWGAKAKKEYILDKNGEKIKLKSGEYKSRKIESNDWNKKETLENWREQWANYANKALEKAGCEDRIDHRSYKDQGVDQVPTIHLGKTSSEMQKKGIDNERVEINKKIKELNKEKVIALQEYRELKAKLENEKATQKFSNLKPEEKAAVQKVEKLLKEPQTYENSNKALDKLNDARQEMLSKISTIDSDAVDISKRINSMKHNSDVLKMAENEFKELPKNIFGQYKDKARAETLKGNIQEYNDKILSGGYHSNFIKLNEGKIGELKTNIEKLKSNIQVIDQTTSTIKNGVKALQNKEVREFHKVYKEQFPQAKFLTYSDMKAIKAANKIMGRSVSIHEIRSTRNKLGNRIEKIDNEILNTKDNNKKNGLQANRIEISPALNVLSDALKCLDNAQRASKVQQNQDDLQLTKAFKGRDYEEERDM
jgi:hypothetical protein